MSALSGSRWLVLGAGRAGVALGSVLQSAGARVAAWSRTADGAARAARQLTEANVSAGPLPDGSYDVCLIAVPDDALPAMVRALGTSAVKAEVWLHVSGARPGDVLSPLGTSVGTCHPLQSLAGTPADVAALRGCFFAVSGDSAARTAAESLALAAGGVPGDVPDEARAAYHMAAVLAGNGVFALLEAARQACERASIEHPALWSGLAALAARSANNAASLGPRAAATGPVIRGDADTVQRHRRWASEQAPDLDALYIALSELLLALRPADAPGDAALRSVLAEAGATLRRPR